MSYPPEAGDKHPGLAFGPSAGGQSFGYGYTISMVALALLTWGLLSNDDLVGKGHHIAVIVLAAVGASAWISWVLLRNTTNRVASLA
ncbi:MAG TPA: hypothetical protein VEJ84_08155, partial [Acidimicrobiales bacterium]|nr:hypothetical protein [Acidimicrobiales bacterium]